MEDVGRLSAECALRECPKGTFLVRPAESRSNEFSLSVKDSNEVKHYRIRMNEDGMMFIAKRSAFSNLVQLVEHYKQVLTYMQVVIPPLAWGGAHLYINASTTSPGSMAYLNLKLARKILVPSKNRVLQL